VANRIKIQGGQLKSIKNNKIMKALKLILVYLLTCNISYVYTQQELKWRLIPTAPVNSPGGRYDDVSFINENAGWAITSDKENNDFVYKTTNGGISWNESADTSLHNLRSIGFADSLNGWLGTLNRTGTVLYNTTNGGSNWLPAVNTAAVDSLGVCGLFVVNKNVVYGCGRYYGPANLFKTTNGGLNWSIKYLGDQITTLIDCFFLNKDSGFVVGGIGNSFNTRSGAILFTSDGGDTWINRAVTPPRGQWCWKISFPDRLHGYVSLEMFNSSPVYFLKTTDGGESWTEKIFLNIYANEEGIGFMNANTGWLGGWYFNTYKTTDGGDTWNLDPWSYNLNRIRKINDTIAFAAGRGIYKYSRDTIVGISYVNQIAAEEYFLYQNFPNPFNPKTVIRYSLMENGFVNLKVYNALGEVVATIVDQKQNSGSYEVDFNGSNFASGVYFYKLETNNFTETKRMILLK